MKVSRIYWRSFRGVQLVDDCSEITAINELFVVSDTVCTYSRFHVVLTTASDSVLPLVSWMMR